MNGTPNEFEVAAIIFLATDDASPTSDPRPTSATPLAIPMDSPAAPGAAYRASSGAPAKPTPPTATVDAPPPLPRTTTGTDTTTVGQVPDTLEVLISKSNFWANALSIEHDRLLNWQRRLGYPVVVVSALTGLAAFSQLESNPSWWATLTVATAAFAAAAFAAVQTQGNFAARATTAAECSTKYATLFRKMLRAGDQLHAGGERNDGELDGLYGEYEQLKSARPTVPERVRDQAHRTVMQEASSIRSQAEARSR